MEVASQPFCYLSEIRPKHVRAWRQAIANAGEGIFTVFVAGQAEYFLGSADLSLHFSGYTRWFDSSRMRVIPHPWSSAERPDETAIEWADKPSLHVGFMGSTYEGSRAGQIVNRAPGAVRDWVLTGHHLRSADLYAAALTARLPLTYAGTFVRSRTMAAMRKTPLAKGGEFRCEARNGFGGTAAEIAAYAEHLVWSTYVLCPRGIENYSFRLYEALRFGRVPVIIDTDMVLPPDVDWPKVALIVPFGELDRLPEIISADWKVRSASAFRERQALARAAAASLDSGQWLERVASEIARRAVSKGAVARRFGEQLAPALG